MVDVFRKSDHRPGRIAYEVAGLAWLADVPDDAAPVVEVAAHGKDWLEEPRLPQGRASAAAAEEFGRRLAHTHAAGASHLGAPPPGDFGQGWMGMARLPLPEVPERSTTSWGDFYARFRLAPYLDAPAFDASDRAILGRLSKKLSSGVYDHAQPRLVRESGHPAARTHGDMWSGNVFWTPDGAVLIDPAAQGGHAEEDLAALAVFGAPHIERIWAAYDEESPLADGWRDRIELHQLHMLMVHCQLFGRSYVPETIAIARRWA
ncbi:MAG: fructosamine kinase family protein [Acidipropionibacterium acidipropionici]|jgi:fructosamine-3-kinase|uniref:Fructosamine kinase n=2 Tax=Acidipropionibacterium acidipropionici TaxID=1748 RepID=A0A142KF00_9ACTN|nr:fructosamine kinase family protein [Acidipropionibacterium acidipropionici]AFV89331.1 Fructosamine kinase [Acidipropionibacterium acidipropionici ATCC 4875]ALN16125.1 fructosamine kinase [Acidipropionibacterium acidipropionici]AMS04688.1 fructosamine kinase [Acidipropionibacterium acidipropionici]AOZ46178.1 fructosamine kinase [Acidipropionibacterium acidipropionici]APZ08126.1 fructosamine kinase [Acidipropionibacterium acidipropionici]